MTIRSVVSEFLGNNDFDNDFFSGDIYSEQEEVLEQAGLVAEEVDQHGGEGEGDEYWRVWSFTKDGETVYVKFNGSYASYCGSEYDSWFWVEPKEVTRTEYFRTK